MKYYQSLVNEAFDKPYPYKKITDQNSHSQYKFETENDVIVVWFIKIKEMHDSKNKNKPFLYNMSFNSAGVDTDEYDEPRNKGDAFKTFATIIKIAKDFYTKSKVGGIIISSKADASRARQMIYKRLVKKFGTGQTVEKVSKYKMLTVSDPELKGGVIVRKKEYTIVNPLDAFMQDSSKILKDIG